MNLGKIINTVNYYIDIIREVDPNVYLVIYQKVDNTINEGPFHKHFIVDARKDEKNASIRQISLPFDNEPKSL